MKKNTYLCQVIELFEHSIENVEQTTVQKKTLSNQLKSFKFKCLNDPKNQPLKNISRYKNKEALKTLYFINFEEPVDQNLLNRAEINLLSVLKYNFNKYNKSIFSTEEIMLDKYDNTFSINLLYKLHTLKKVR